MKIIIELIFFAPLVLVPIYGFYWGKAHEIKWINLTLILSAILSAYTMFIGYGAYKILMPKLPDVLQNGNEAIALIVLLVSWPSAVFQSRLFPELDKIHPLLDSWLGIFLDYLFLFIILFGLLSVASFADRSIKRIFVICKKENI